MFDSCCVDDAVVVVVVVDVCSYFCFVTCFVTISETQNEWMREKGGRGRELEGVAKERKKPRQRG